MMVIVMVIQLARDGTDASKVHHRADAHQEVRVVRRRRGRQLVRSAASNHLLAAPLAHAIAPEGIQGSEVLGRRWAASKRQAGGVVVGDNWFWVVQFGMRGGGGVNKWVYKQVVGADSGAGGVKSKHNFRVLVGCCCLRSLDFGSSSG